MHLTQQIRKQINTGGESSLGDLGLEVFGWWVAQNTLKRYNYTMSDSNYCQDCKRLKDIACTCGMSFGDKIKTSNINWASWSDTRK